MPYIFFRVGSESIRRYKKRKTRALNAVNCVQLVWLFFLLSCANSWPKRRFPPMLTIFRYFESVLSPFRRFCTIFVLTYSRQKICVSESTFSSNYLIWFCITLPLLKYLIAISLWNFLSDSVFMRHFVILIILWALEGIIWPPAASGATLTTCHLFILPISKKQKLFF